MRISIDSGENPPPARISSKGQFPRPQLCSLATMYNHVCVCVCVCVWTAMGMDVSAKTSEIQLILVVASWKLSVPPGNLSSPIPPPIPLILHPPHPPIPLLRPSPWPPSRGAASRGGSFLLITRGKTLQLLGGVGPLRSRRCSGSSSWGVWVWNGGWLKVSGAALEDKTRSFSVCVCGGEHLSGGFREDLNWTLLIYFRLDFVTGP